MKKIVYILILAMILILCGCGAPAEEPNTPEPEKAEEPENSEPAKEETAPEPKEETKPEPVPEEPELTVHGLYNLYSIKMGERQMKPSEMSVTCSISLLEDGTGSMTMNGVENPLSKWEEAGGKLTLYNANGDPLDCELKDGIITIEMGEDYYWYLAHEGTGITDPDAGKQFESMLYAFCQGIDGSAGAHLSYESHSDYMDSTSTVDVQAKGGVFYSDKTAKVGGAERRSATFFKDGTAYVLYPDEMKGNVATEMTSSILTENILMLDDLYKIIYMTAQRGDYTAEARDMDGAAYKAEVFPATDLSSETVFYFDEAGALKYVLEGAPKMMPEMGKTLYTVRSVDTAVNESLFDISGYSIEQ